jgi:hypothetical protein
MPSPSSSLATQRPDLEASFWEYDLEASQRDFIGHKLFPVLPVSNQAGNFGRMQIDQMLQRKNTRRAPGANYARGDFKFAPDKFATQENGWEEPVDDREAAAYANYFDAEQVATIRAYDTVIRNQEQRIAGLVMNTATFPNAPVSTVWTNGASATPLDDFQTARQVFRAQCGYWPNVAVLDCTTFGYLTRCQQIIDQIKFSGKDDPKTKNIGADMIAALFNLEELLVPEAAENAADEGQTVSFASIWNPNYCLLARRDMSMDFRRMCIGRIFAWKDGGGDKPIIETYRDETRRGDVVRVRMDTDEHMLYGNAGYLLTGVNTTSTDPPAGE